jgi:hypothetical protein
MGTVSTEAHRTMNRRTLQTLLWALAVSTWTPPSALAQEAGASPGRSLDLSLPGEARPFAWGAPAATGGAGLPDLGGTPGRSAGLGPGGRGGGPRSDLPYGAGYEARHGLGASRGGSGALGGGGGAHGMGRGCGR